MDWAGYPPLELTIECGGLPHTLTWEAGRLEVPQHDEQGEDLLAALGGRSPACFVIVELLDALARERSSVEVLPLLSAASWAGDANERAAELRDRLDAATAPPPPVPQVHGPIPPEHRAAMQQAQLEYRARQHQRAVAARLPVPWLLVAVAEHLASVDRWHRIPGDDRSSIRDAVKALATCELETCAPAEVVLPAIRIDEWSVASLVDGSLVLPPAWVSRVLARQASVIDGRFVMDLIPHADGRFVARVLDVSARGRVSVLPAITAMDDRGVWRSE